MSASTQSKRQKKIKKVMGEFKSGDLRSGGSGKKVTNPKQAIAIALAEANRMNQGGMMYEEIMNRPMFQTPQMRQGGGIMAGIAPIRGYAEGDLVSNEESGFFDTLRDMVVGDDGTLDDFFTTERTAEGQGLNLRDLTDFFLVDPNDPVDVGLASTSAALMAGGVTAPGALAAQLGRLGYKGKKLFDVLNKAENLNKTKAVASVYGASQGGRLAGDVPEIVTTLGQAGDDIRELILSGDTESEEGPSFSRLIEKGDTLSQIARDNDTTVAALMAANPQIEDPDLIYAGRSINIPGSRKGIAALADKDVAEFADGGIASIHGYNLGGLIKRGAEASVDFVRNLMSRSKKGEDVTEEVADAVDKGKISPKEGEDILKSKTDKSKTDDVADDLADAPTPPKPPSLAKRINKAALITAGGVGGVYGLSELPGLMGSEGDQSKSTGESPADKALTDEELALRGLAYGPAPFGVPPEEASVYLDPKTGQYKKKATGIKKFLFGEDGIGGKPGFAGNVLEKLKDPRTQYALAKAAQPSEGIVPRSFLADAALAGREYDIQEAELERIEQASKPEIVQQFEALREYAVPREGESEFDVDRRVFKSLFDDMTAASQLEALLTLYKVMPNAEQAGQTLEQFAQQLGVGSVSRLLTKPEDME